ncbi:MAG: hypothetical protein WDM78_11905 [Puia sp.]
MSDIVDPTFRFMSVDWDGKIRMTLLRDYAMQRLIGMKDKYDISVACDTDHDSYKKRWSGAAESLPDSLYFLSAATSS